MLEDVIKTKMVCGKSVSVLWYSIDKEDRYNEDNHRKYYEVRVSFNDEEDNFYTDSEFYLKKDALRTFEILCKEIEKLHNEIDTTEYLVKQLVHKFRRK